MLFPYEQTTPNLTVANYFATKQFLTQKKDVAEPDGVRKAVLTYTKIPPQAAEVMKLPQWKADLNKPTIELTSNLAKEYGYIKSQPNLDDLIWQP